MFRFSRPLLYKSTLHFPKTSFPQRPPAAVLPSVAKTNDELSKALVFNKNPELTHVALFQQGKSLSQTTASSEAIPLGHREFNRNDLFIMHDGPPYANGSLHMGHALNKILKDVSSRYHMVRYGKKLHFSPGWDCHGLPIELKAEQLFGNEADPLKIRSRAMEFALSAVEHQKKHFQDFGVAAQWDQKYLTLNRIFEANELLVFKEMWKNGFIFRGERPVYWSWSTRTALAEAELEYDENHVSDALYIGFPVLFEPNNPNCFKELEGAEFLIWTTTPWSLIGNEAVAFHDELEYCLLQVEKETSARKFIVATNLVESLKSKAFAGARVEILKRGIMGEQLHGLRCFHPLNSLRSVRNDENIRPLLHGAHVTSESGTGLVHTAPGHGHDDFQIGKKHKLQITSPIGDQGHFLANPTSVPSHLHGLFFTTDGANAIMEELSNCNAIVFREKYKHKYPYDWRSKKPVFIRSTKQWFADVENLKQKAIEELEKVRVIPETGRSRLRAAIVSRSEWCISRQRTWGVPIPVFYYDDPATGEEITLATEETIDYVIEKVREHGTNCWWEFDVMDLLPEKYRNDGITYRKGMDTLDVWFDSGTTWKSVLPPDETGRQVADLYLEGVDQYRGWFQSSLLTSVAMGNGAPFKTLVTHGFVNDENGRKMSKSIGNIIEPNDLLRKMKINPDILRLWATNADFAHDVQIGNTIIDVQIRLYKKIRNTFKFMLGVTSDFSIQEHSLENLEKNLLPYDRYMLHKLSEFQRDIEKKYDDYQYFRVTDAIHAFVYEVSAFYLDIVKDRLYSSIQDDPSRRSCQYVMSTIIQVLLKAIAPIMPHLSEEIFDHYKGFTTVQTNSVFDTPYEGLPPPDFYLSSSQVQAWKQILSLRTLANKSIEILRQDKVIGSSLEVSIHLEGASPTFYAALNEIFSTDKNTSSIEEQLSEILISSHVHLNTKSLDLTNFYDIESQTHASNPPEGKKPLVSRSLPLEDGEVKLFVHRVEDAHKCVRCWRFLAPVQDSLCHRCDDVVNTLGYKPEESI